MSRVMKVTDLARSLDTKNTSVLLWKSYSVGFIAKVSRGTFVRTSGENVANNSEPLELTQMTVV